MAEHYTDEDVERVAFQLYRSAGGMDWPRMSSASDREFYAPRAVTILDAVAPAIAARALLNAAEFFETDMPQAWGGDEPWMTNGTKCASVVAAVLRECANFEIEGR